MDGICATGESQHRLLYVLMRSICTAVLIAGIMLSACHRQKAESEGADGSP